MSKLLNFYSIIFLHFAPRLRGAAIHSEQSGNHKTHIDKLPMYSYKNPEEWKVYNSNCNGQRQSPVNILSANMALIETANPLTWKGYREQPLNMSLENNGHAVEIKVQWEHNPPYITGGAAGDSVYVFDSMHFHWAHHDEVGSEHTVNNYSFPIEMHLVHHNNRYQSFEEARENFDGLLVVAFFYELNEESNYALDSLREGLKAITETGSHVNIKPFPLERFHLEFHDKYTAYLGSLTTPPCQESVLWILASEPLSLTRKQIELFRTIHLSNKDDHNNRPTQPLNNRRIFYFSDTE
ncbi:carbonic anhydrase 2 [Cephus cinctus]|uniref:Carbonic anhydrase n=1 Tax=Cephus cinctus TaxID=211228 RepID=A0AAJ7FC88_CEPCN|nr:carbonic anhydrase 2 [Cephus cinctus]XP_015584688.1 carbonic anhydrase 2 [Cephus cinctus]XP_015584690.1 carbonic anhydrase 2 [Cephus cinctus]XP_024935878.1 carbonic anhydrase 2 [Cephus cinctus]XP_024935879.1 carbonic anhydrase 2 [Cephus cinctus]